MLGELGTAPIYPTVFFFANTSKRRKDLKDIRIDGASPEVALTETMVGHSIVTRRLRGDTTRLVNERAEEMITRASRIEKSDLPPKVRRRLIEASAVPVSRCACQRNLPRADLQVKAASTIVNALRGRRRKLRSREIVLAVLHEPTKVDPASTMVYKRFVDARRVFLRSESRHNHAIHTSELLGTNETPTVVGPVHGLRKAANAIGGRLMTSEGGLYVHFLDGDPPPPPHTHDWFAVVCVCVCGNFAFGTAPTKPL